MNPTGSFSVYLGESVAYLESDETIGIKMLQVSVVFIWFHPSDVNCYRSFHQMYHRNTAYSEQVYVISLSLTV